MAVTSAGDCSESKATDSPLVVRGLEEIAGRYDGFIFDQYGVLHNGQAALPGAPECVLRLHDLGKKMAILSNASGRAAAAIQRLPKLGLTPEHFAGGVVTSGEQAYLHLMEMTGSKRCLWLSWASREEKGFADYLEGIPDLQLASSCEGADFVFLQGVQALFAGTAAERTVSFDQDKDFGAVDPLLRECAARRLPMLCANPDYFVVSPSGTKTYMPGLWAKRYAELLEGMSPGSSAQLVSLFGKPGERAFREAKQRLTDLGCSRICHVGDSLEHDIAGARAAGIDVVFIAGGIHNDDLQSSNSASESASPHDVSEAATDLSGTRGEKRQKQDTEQPLMAEAVAALSRALGVATPTYAAKLCVF